jgi:hypothetical protein
VLAAISQMKLNKAPGPDGFRAEFYQKIWEVIQYDLMALFVQLQKEELPLYKLNFGVITLLLKKRMRFIYNNTDLYASLMLALRFLQRWLRIE